MKFFFVLFSILLLSSCADITPYQKELLTFRKEKDFHFKNMPDSPIPDTLKPQFKGLSYFPIDEKWIFKAQFTPQSDSNDSEIAGFIQFQYQNQNHQLKVFWENTSNKNLLFLPFKDQTSGTITYGGGRYLNIAYQGKNEITLDFNYSYHPFCVYNSEYICKKPPKENTLNFEILAGEKL